MPIANRFLSTHRSLYVKNPVFTSSGDPTLQGSSFFEIACKSFSTQIQSDVSGHQLVQAWPMVQYLDIKPFVYTTKIEIPVLIDKSGIRTAELSFFAAWLKYMLSTYEQISDVAGSFKSLVVENASISASEEEVLLSLTLQSNFPLGWGPSVFGAATTRGVHARKAKYYDTYVKYTPVNQTISNDTVLGWNNTYGISSFNINYTSDLEKLFLTNHPGNKTELSTTYIHATDMINVKSVSCNGDISFLGPEIELYPVSIQYATYGGATMYFNTVSQDVFSMSLNSGGVQIYVGDLGETNDYSRLTPLTYLPTGTIVSEASADFTGEIYRHSRKFHGMFTDIPQNMSQAGTSNKTNLT